VTRRTRRHLTAALSLALAASLVSCTGDDGEQPEDAAASVAALLERGKVGRVPWVEAPPRPQQWWQGLTGDLGVRPSVAVGEVVEAESGDQATARLTWTWPLQDGESPWEHTGTLRLVRAGDEGGARWRVHADRALLDLRRGERLDLRRELPPRAPVLGAGDTEIVVERPVLRFGVDKTRVSRAGQAEAARRLAAAVDVDAGSLVERVRAAGVDGLEVHHVDHDPGTRERFLRLAERLDLVPTAGSDYHGEAVAPDRHLGDVSMPEEDLARLEARRP